MQDTLFTWQGLVTIGGASMLTFLIVLYTGRLIDNWWKAGTDLYALIWAFIILSVANIATGGNPLNWQLYALAFCNSFLVAAASGKLRDKSVTELERKKGVMMATGQEDINYDYKGSAD